MTNTLTDAMVADMDSTSDFMHTIPAPFPVVRSTAGFPVQRPPTLYRIKGLVTPYSRGISVTGREQGIADAHRRDAIKRGGI